MASVTLGTVKKQMKKYGWVSGFNSPFANKENQALELKLEKIQKENTRMRHEIIDDCAHIDQLRGLEKNLATTMKITQSNSASLEEHIRHEADLLKQGKRNVIIITTDVKNIEKELNKVRERSLFELKNHEVRRVKVETLKQNFKKSSGFLKALEKRKKDIDAAMDLMEKFENEDEKYLEETRKNIGYQEIRRQTLRSSLDAEVHRSEKCAETYYRLCLEYRENHAKRIEMLKNWKSAIGAVHVRDSELQIFGNEFEEKRNSLRKLEAENECTLSYIERTIEEGEETEFQLQYYDQLLRKLDESIANSRSHLISLKSIELHLKSKIRQTGSVLSDKRLSAEAVRGDYDFYAKKGDVIHSEIEELRERRNYMSLNDSFLDQEYQELRFEGDKFVNQVKRLENELKANEKAKRELEAKGDRVRYCMFNKTNEKFDLKNELKTLESRFSLIKQIQYNMEVRAFHNMSMISECQGRVYRAELTASNIEIKISHLLIATVDPSTFRLQTECSELRKRIESLSRTNTHVLKEKYKIEEVVDKFRKACQRHVERGWKLDTEVFEKTLELTDVERYWNGLKDEIKRLTIYFRVTEIQKLKLERSVTQYDAKLYDASQIRTFCNMAASERKVEIDTLKSLLNRKIVLYKKEISQFEAHRGKINRLTKQLQSRYLVITGKKMNEKEGSLLIKIRKLINERNMLKRTQQALIDSNAKDEEEIKALMNVVGIVEISNEAFKTHLHPAPNSKESERAHERNEMEQKLMIHRNRCKEEVSHLRPHIKDLKNELILLQQDVKKRSEELGVKSSDVSYLESENSQLRTHIVRWEQRIGAELRKISNSTQLAQSELTTRGHMLRESMMLAKITHARDAIKKLIRLMRKNETASEARRRLRSLLQLTQKYINNDLIDDLEPDDEDIPTREPKQKNRKKTQQQPHYGKRNRSILIM